MNPYFLVRVGGNADPVASDVVVNVNQLQNKFVVTDSGGVELAQQIPQTPWTWKFAQRPAVFPKYDHGS